MNFIRGQKTKLSDLGLGTTLEVNISLEGGVFSGYALGVDPRGTVNADFAVFYNHPSSAGSEIKALGGSGTSTGTSLERFELDLARFQPRLERVIIVLRGNASELRSGKISLLHPLSQGGREVAQFSFSSADFRQEKAIIALEIYFKDVWRVAAVGQGFNKGLSELLASYGAAALESSLIAPPKPKPAPIPTPISVSVPPIHSPMPPNAGRISLGKLTLEKQGERAVVNLDKQSGRPVHLNLNWKSGKKGFLGFFSSGVPDLDLGCLFRMQDGSKGVIQALGGNFGAKQNVPYIWLDKDDRSGAAQDGENLYLERPELLERVMIFAFIYSGTGNFRSVEATMTITDPQGHQIIIPLNNPDSSRTFCAVCLIESKNGQVSVTKEERYFHSHPEADHHYGFDFKWVAGSKE
jgi:tellurite resistance protein TerA